MAPRSTLASGTFFHGEKLSSSANSRRASCQLLAKKWAHNTGKLPSGGTLRNSMVKLLTVPTSPQLFTVDIKQQIKQACKHNRTKPFTLGPLTQSFLISTTNSVQPNKLPSAVQHILAQAKPHLLVKNGNRSLCTSHL